MQVEQNSFLKFTPQIISNKLHHLFEEKTTDKGETLLTPQPAAQRRLF